MKPLAVGPRCNSNEQTNLVDLILYGDTLPSLDTGRMCVCALVLPQQGDGTDFLGWEALPLLQGADGRWEEGSGGVEERREGELGLECKNKLIKNIIIKKKCSHCYLYLS